MARNTSSRRLVPTTVAPWRRISTTECLPSARASEAPSAGFTTRRLVSPKSSRLSQNGPTAPIPAPGWNTRTNGSPLMQGGMMMAHRDHVRPRLEDLAMDDALRIEVHGRRLDGLRVEVELQDVVRLHQLGGTRAREEIAPRIVGMADADMAEGVDHAFVGEN